MLGQDGGLTWVAPTGIGAAAGRNSHVRWRIVALLFASTVINYIDRQNLSVLAPQFKTQYHWTNQDFAYIVIAFRLAYTVGQAVCGRLIDRLGTRRGLTISVIAYSTISMLTSFATGFRSFCAFRFLLGAAESANWPAATKAVSEWFPRRERAVAVAIFDSGSSIGAAIAPWLVLTLYSTAGGWRPVFVITGLLGFIWIFFWRRFYYPPEVHPAISDTERALIVNDRDTDPIRPISNWLSLLRYRQTWGAIASRALTDPVWFFISDWFALYLVSRGFKPEDSLLAFWVPFVAADLGNYFGGIVSSWLVRRGFSLEFARKAIVVPGAFGVLALIPAAYSDSLTSIALLFATATFSYSAFSTMANTFPADLFQREAVATVSGMGGAAAGTGTILCTFAIGYLADHLGFRPALIGASVIPTIAMLLVLILVRNTKESGKGVLLRI